MIRKFFQKEWSQKDIEELEFSIVSREHDLSALEKFCRYLLVAHAAALISSFTSLGTNWKNPFLVGIISKFIPFFLGGLILTSFCYLTLYICDGLLRRLEYENQRNAWHSSNRNKYSKLFLWKFLFIALAVSSLSIFFLPLFVATYEVANYAFSFATD